MAENIELRLIEDRAMRDAAKAIVRADMTNIKADLSHKGVGTRLSDRFTEGAIDVLEQAAVVADDNKGVLATLIAAIVLWFARNPILEAFDAGASENDDPDVPNAITRFFHRTF